LRRKAVAAEIEAMPKMPEGKVVLTLKKEEDKETEKRESQIKCYQCGKLGHIRINCNANRCRGRGRGIYRSNSGYRQVNNGRGNNRGNYQNPNNGGWQNPNYNENWQNQNNANTNRKLFQTFSN
jgi:Zinc knuckle